MSALIILPLVVVVVYYLLLQFKSVQQRTIIVASSLAVFWLLAMGHGNFLILPTFFILPLALLALVIMKLQQYVFSRFGIRYLTGLVVLQFLIPILCSAFLLYQFNQGTHDGSIDGPGGMVALSLISLLFLFLSILAFISLYTAIRISRGKKVKNMHTI